MVAWRTCQRRRSAGRRAAPADVARGEVAADTHRSEHARDKLQLQRFIGAQVAVLGGPAIQLPGRKPAARGQLRKALALDPLRRLELCQHLTHDLDVALERAIQVQAPLQPLMMSRTVSSVRKRCVFGPPAQPQGCIAAQAWSSGT